MKRRVLIQYLTQHGCHLIREGAQPLLVGQPRKNRRSAIPRHSEVPELLAGKFARIWISRSRDHMIDLCELLFARGLPRRPRRTKLVRHQTNEWDLHALVANGQIDLYQSNQSRNIFGACDFVAAFIGERHSLARLIGVYSVGSVADEPNRAWPIDYLCPQIRPGRYWYEMKKLPAFSDLDHRVVIAWGKSALAWHQWLGPREVVEILPAGYVRDFPGFDNVLLRHSELRAIIRHPTSNREWHRALGSIAGVYLITDLRDGRQYVGSASGAGGILGRWTDYAHDGHGGNRRLRDLLESAPEAARHFQYSILRPMTTTTTKDEILAAELVHKRKLGSRAFGLNVN